MNLVPSGSPSFSLFIQQPDLFLQVIRPGVQSLASRDKVFIESAPIYLFVPQQQAVWHALEQPIRLQSSLADFFGFPFLFPIGLHHIRSR